MIVTGNPSFSYLSIRKLSQYILFLEYSQNGLARAVPSVMIWFLHGLLYADAELIYIYWAHLPLKSL